MKEKTSSAEIAKRWWLNIRQWWWNLPGELLLRHQTAFDLALVVVFSVVALYLMVTLLLMAPAQVLDGTAISQSLNQGALTEVEQWLDERQEQGQKGIRVKAGAFVTD